MLLLPCFRPGLVGKSEELGLDGFLLGQQELCSTDGIPGGRVLPLELFVLDHEQDLFVNRANQVPRGGGGVTHHVLQIPDVVPDNLCGRSNWNGGQHDLQVSLYKSSYSAQCPVLASQTFLWGHWAVRGALSVSFWFNPPVVEGSASPTPLMMRFACFEERAPHPRAEAGSAIC